MRRDNAKPRDRAPPRVLETVSLSDVVTGKLDVREAVADLPDDVDEVEITGDQRTFDIEDLPADELGDIEEELE